MSNFGFTRLRVVKPYEPAFREARSAVGASEVLANAEQLSSVADAVADCTLVVGTTAARRREILHPVENLEAGAQLIRERVSSGPVALLFGSEKTGLSNKDFSHCDWLLRIPTRIEHPSMNIGQAVAICLYEIARREVIRTAHLPNVATSSQLERITCLLIASLRASAYVRAEDKTIEERIRRMVRGLNIPSEDATTWMGLLRQITWKLQH